MQVYIVGMLNRTEELFDVSFYEAQLKVLQEDPSTRIVGSIGRMLACQEILGRPFQEFEDRVAAGVNRGRISDIDVLGTSPRTIAEARYAGDASIDSRAFFDIDVTIANEEDKWYLRSIETDFEAPISTKLMEPVRGKVLGVEVVTVPLLTHRALHTLRESNTRKDRLTSNTIGYLLHTVALENQSIPRLNSEDLRPFQQLQTRLQLLRGSPTSATRSGKYRHSE